MLALLPVQESGCDHRRMARTSAEPSARSDPDARLPAVLLTLNCALAIASVPPSLQHEPLYDTVLYPLNGVILGLAGLLILSRHRHHAIGWLLTGMGVLASGTELTEGYGYHPAWPAADLVQWSSSWTSITGASMTAIVLLLFPAGHIPSSRWRPLLWTGVVSVVLSAFSAAFGHSSDDAFRSGTNPYAVNSPVVGVIGAIGSVGFLIALVGAGAALLVRFRNAERAEREQLKWVAYVVGLLAMVGPFAIFWYYDSQLVQIAIALVVPLLPIGICVAILRYRLYDIDLLISRTIAYLALTVLLAAAFMAVTLGLGAALGDRHSTFVTAAATLAAAAAFLPLRRRVQSFVDRRFRRARFDAQARVDASLADLRAGRVAPEALEPVLREILDRPGLIVHYVLPSGLEIDAHGTAIPDGRTETRPGAETFVERNGVRLALVAQPGGRPASPRGGGRPCSNAPAWPSRSPGYEQR